MTNYKNFSLALLLIFAPFAIGSIHPWSITVCLVLSTIIFSFELFERGLMKRAPSIGIAGWVFIGLCLFTIVQLLPLPAGMVKILSPGSAEIQESLFTSLLKENPPTLMSLTLDRFSTLLGLMKISAAALLFLAVRQRIRKEGSSDVLRCVAWSGVAVSLIFFLHRLAGWEKVFELYSPLYAPTEPLSAPLLNANHLSGYLGLSAAVSVGLAFSEKERMKRLLLIFAAGFTGGGVFLTLSRGGILCFVGGQLLFITVLVIARLREKSRKRLKELKFLPLALAVGLGSGIYVAYQAVLQEFLYGDTSKLKIPADALPMLKDFWLTGVGRGNFQLGYTMYQKLSDGSTYTSPENFIAQYLTEWGAIAGGALLLLIFTVLLLGLLKPPRRGRNIGALVALFSLTVQNFADFSLELLGVLLPFMVLLSSTVVTIENAYGIVHRGNKKEGLTGKYVPGLMGAAAAAAALILCGVGYHFTSRYNLEKETGGIRELLVKNTNEDKFLKDVTTTMKRHPADYYFPLLAGIKIYHGGDHDPLRYLGRALLLFPKSSASHLYVARTLSRSGHLNQALLEYMEAVRSNPGLAPKISREVAGITGGFDAAKKMTRTDDDRLLVYDTLSAAFRAARMEEESVKADEALLRIDPFAEGAAERKIRRLIQNEETGKALELIQLIEGKEALESLAIELRGELEEKKGNLVSAAKNFIQAWKKEPKRRHLLLKAAQTYSLSGDKKKMYKYLGEYEASAPDAISKGHAILHRARLEHSLKMHDKALASYHAAASYLPDDPSIWQSIAGLALARKDTARQLKAYKELRRIQPDNEEWQKKIDEIQHRLNATILH